MLERSPLVVKGYTISWELLTKGYPAGHGPCKCASRCCAGGVYVDLKERDIILANASQIQKQMDASQDWNPEHWFEAGEIDHPDFPSGRCVGTNEINNKCAFLDAPGRCAIQMAAVAAGRHRWALKPLYCILFPIEISNRVIRFDDLLQGEAECCSVRDTFETPLFRGCRDELVHLLGEDGYEEIERFYASLNVNTLEVTTKENVQS